MSDAIDRSALDQLQPATLDPAIWTANAAALKLCDAALLSRLAAAWEPLGWQAAVALDGATTFRSERAGQPAQWLARTAAPLARAEALLRESALDRNPLLSSIGAGYELALLLERLPPQHAVFVSEPELANLAAALHLHDFSAALTAGRIVLLTEQDIGPRLHAALQQRVGLLPPATIICLPDVDPQRNTALHAACEHAAREVGQQRQAALQALTTTPVLAEAGRLALVALHPAAITARVVTDLQAAAEQAGLAVCVRRLHGPDDAHTLAHCRALADFRPQRILFVDTPRAAIPLQFAGRSLAYYTHASHVPERLSDPELIFLAGTPAAATALRSAGAAEAQVRELPLAVRRVPSEPGCALKDEVLLIADRLDASDAALGIDQPTHKHLWSALQAAAQAACETAKITRPESLLRSAERGSGVTLQDPQLRQHWLRLLEAVLIPAILVERMSAALDTAGLRVRCVGRGWPRESRGRAPLTAEESLCLSESWQDASPAAAVFVAWSDPLTPDLLIAAAAGWPLLLFAPNAAWLRGKLGTLLSAGQHLLSFSSAAELRAALNLVRSDRAATQRRSQTLRAHLSQHHLYARRIEQLDALLHERRS